MKTPKEIPFRKDTSRYIAHAGGNILDFHYTNALEALNLSYEKGFKLFELDLIITSDHEYVAAHDWQMWQRMTDFQGNIPPTKNEFLQHKIHQQFTPLDMESINLWFQKHPNAILVTDKVNEPKRFANEFIDSKRLMMELFDTKSLDEALSFNVLAMASQDLIRDYSAKDVLELKDKGVEYIVISQKFIRGNESLLEQFKTHGIKAYVFDLDKEFNENYMTQNFQHLIYGMYANDWNFEDMP